MLFNSLHFLIFFPLVVLIYYIIPPKGRYIWLLLTSYYFYMCWNVKYVLLLLFSTIITYLSGLCLEFLKSKQDKPFYEQKRKLCVAGSFIINLAILFLFKYFNFFTHNIQRVLGLFDIDIVQPTFDVLLPVGISFYTFQALSYTMDVYRNEISAEKNFARYALFVSFFPQLVAGPIERSKNLLKQLKKPAPITLYAFNKGILLMLWGYFLKLVLADRIAIFVDTVYGDYDVYSGWYLIVATLLFAVQIYCDFAGYSVIAMGAAKILGIELMENFDAPYLSKSVTEFWRRWHISLSSWLKDYLYIPLGGNRKGKIRKQINLLIVFLLSGFWHGAQWNYLIWGALNGAYQIIGNMLLPIRRKTVSVFAVNCDSFIYKSIQVLITFFMIDFTWIFFRADGWYSGFCIVQNILTADNFQILFDSSLYQCGLNRPNFILMIICILILIVADICKYLKISISTQILKHENWAPYFVMVFAACFILLFGIWGPGYNEANFIYFQF